MIVYVLSVEGVLASGEPFAKILSVEVEEGAYVDEFDAAVVAAIGEPVVSFEYAVA